MSDDIELLRRYVVEKSEAAFAELVRLHLGLVYHTALRHLNGDTHAAEDVAQSVFTDLARKAASLTDRPLLAGWLHVSARYAALQHVRSTRRREVREKEAQLMQETNQTDETPMGWDQLRGVIDEALLALKPRDREAVLMRYFEGRDYPAVAARLNLSASGARICVERALDKMQARLARHGIRSSVAALGSALAAYAAGEGVPAHLLAAGIAHHALLDAATAAAAGGAAVASGGAAFSLGALGVWKLSSLLFAGSLAGNAALGLAFIQSMDTPAGEAGVAPVAAAKAPAPARQAMTQLITDPVEIGRRLKTAGFADKTVTSAMGAAVSLEMGAAIRAEGENYHARVRRWNPSPQASVAVAPGLGRPARVDLQNTPERLRRKAVLAELGYDDSGVPFASLYRGLSAEKAKAVRRIEDDYKEIQKAATVQVGNSGSVSAAAMNAVAAQFEADIRAALSPAEATDYFRYHSEAVREIRQVLGDLPMTDAVYADIADAALAVDRARRAPRTVPQEAGRDETNLQEVGRRELALLEAWRRGLGDEAFLQLSERMPRERRFVPADAFYRELGFPTGKRADLLIAYSTIVHPANWGGAGTPATMSAVMARAYAALTTGAGLTPAQITAFDATSFGRELKARASGSVPSAPAP